MFEGLEYYLRRKLKLLLLRPFSYWRAYGLGIIDDKGNLLRSPRSDEKDVFNVFDNLIRKIKQLFLKYVPNKGIVRHVVFKSFLEDDIVKYLDESVITEGIDTDFMVRVEDWLKKKGF
jgi:hypothetical protein